MKHCTKCSTTKEKSEFAIFKNSKDGKHSVCKLCANAYRDVYSKTVTGVITKMYGTQRASSKKRQHPIPNYSKIEFTDWLLQSTNFTTLYSNWEKSGYQKKLVPSADRLNDSLPYTLDNLQVITWEENDAKCHKDMKEGRNNSINKTVLQFTLDGIFVQEFHSAIHAGRMTGIDRSSISKVCRGTVNKAGEFKWKYKNTEWENEHD
jgi:hypothetical protein